MFRFAVVLLCCTLFSPPSVAGGESVYTGRADAPSPTKARVKNPDKTCAERTQPARTGINDGASGDGKEGSVFGIGNIYMNNSRGGSLVNQTEIRNSTIIMDNR